MSEVKTEPVLTHDKDGNEIWSFDERHTLADIVRWIMRNRSEAEEVSWMLKAHLDGSFEKVMQ